MASGAAVMGYIVAASALASAGAAVYSATRKTNVPRPGNPPELPELPSAVSPVEDQRRRSGRASTLLTTPSSLSDPTTTKPTLLGL